METFSLKVNGIERTLQADVVTPLLYVLRNDLGLTGTRFGCGQNLCGACTVVIDGRASFSCDLPIWMVEGKNIETIEGLSRDGELHPLQQAFISEQAGQCGYCLNGIIMAAKALLDSKPKPSREEIRHALRLNLCRCGSHVRILRAIERVAAYGSSEQK